MGSQSISILTLDLNQESLYLKVLVVEVNIDVLKDLSIEKLDVPGGMSKRGKQRKRDRGITMNGIMNIRNGPQSNGIHIVINILGLVGSWVLL